MGRATQMIFGPVLSPFEITNSGPWLEFDIDFTFVYLGQVRLKILNSTFPRGKISLKKIIKSMLLSLLTVICESLSSLKLQEWLWETVNKSVFLFRWQFRQIGRNFNWSNLEEFYTENDFLCGIWLRNWRIRRAIFRTILRCHRAKCYSPTGLHRCKFVISLKTWLLFSTLWTNYFFYSLF